MGKLRLGQLDFSGGSNTKDHPRDLAKDECQELVNAYPSYEPRPREGCPRWNQTLWKGDVYELIEWRDVSGDKAIAWTSYGFEWAKRGAQEAYTICSGEDHTPIAGSRICWQRVENALIIGSDDRNGWSKIIEWDHACGSFFIRNANIKMPSGLGLTLAPATEPGKLTGGKWYSYAVTIVNRGVARVEEGLDSGYNPGLLESWEDLNKRTTVYLPDGYTSIGVTVSGASDIDPQATHIRLYRTQPQDTEEEAKGFTHGWIRDIHQSAISVDGTASAVDGEAGSETDPSPSTSGLNEMPACRAMIYMNGRLWINGAFGGSPGRWWFSSGIQNAMNYLKHLTLFALSADFKDCSLDDAQEATGAAIAGGDLYFFNSRSIFQLADGDVTATPRVVSTSVGCPFPRTITPVNTWIYFLSYNGPKLLQAGSIDPVQGFKRGEIWPNSREGGSIIKHGREDANAVVGFWYRQTWWIADGRTVVGYYNDDASGVKGSFRVEFADPAMALRRAVVFSDEEALIAGDDRRMIWFLRSDNHTDDGYWITLKVKTQRLFVDVKDPSKLAEPYDIRIGARYTDKGALKVRLVGDEEMFRKSFVYQQRGADALLQPQGVPQGAINSYQQAVPAWLLASHFDLTVEKMLRPPFDFTLTSAEIRVIPKNSRPQYSVSMDLGSDDPIDGGMGIVDVGDAGGP